MNKYIILLLHYYCVNTVNSPRLNVSLTSNESSLSTKQLSRQSESYDKKKPVIKEISDIEKEYNEELKSIREKLENIKQLSKEQQALERQKIKLDFWQKRVDLLENENNLPNYWEKYLSKFSSDLLTINELVFWYNNFLHDVDSLFDEMRPSHCKKTTNEEKSEDAISQEEADILAKQVDEILDAHPRKCFKEYRTPQKDKKIIFIKNKYNKIIEDLDQKFLNAKQLSLDEQRSKIPEIKLEYWETIEELIKDNLYNEMTYMTYMERLENPIICYAKKVSDCLSVGQAVCFQDEMNHRIFEKK